MGLNLGTMSAAVTLDDADFRNKLNGLEGASSSTFQKIGQLAAGYLSARALFGFVQGAMAEFSKLEEGNNKLKYAYSELREEAQRTAETIANTYNLASSTASNAIADIGDLLTGLGFSQGNALGFAKQITERGIDVASFKGLDQTEVIRRMTVALTGETESLKSMGIIVRQGSDEFANQVKNIMESTGATETMAKAQVILQEIMKQTSNAAGDYLRPDAPRTYAQELTDLKEAVKQFKTEIGSQIQPITQETVARASQLLTWYNKLTPSAKSLANATTVLGASMAILSSTKFGRSILQAGNSSNNEEAEKAAVEEKKRAEAEKTDAVYAAIHARQKMRLAEEEKEAAEISLKKIQLAKAEAQAKGDTATAAQAAAAELQAQEAVTAATIKARKAESEYHAARENMAAATANYNAISSALPGVLSSIAASSSIAGNASIFLSGGLKKACLAVKTFFATLGPVGWTILASVAAFEAISAAIDIYNGKLEENARNAANAANEAASAADANHKQNAEQSNYLNRIEKLQKYESLNNAEKEEAKKLLSELCIAYDENGNSIDEMIARQGAEKKSLAELIALRKEELKQKRIAAIEDAMRKNQEAIDANDKRKVGFWGALARGVITAGQWTGEGKNNEIDAENQKFYDANTKLRQELSALKNDEIKIGETEDQRNKRNFEAAKKLRDELEKLTGKEWQIKFDNSSAEVQTAMLTDKIEKTFSEYKRKGKYSSVEDFKFADRSKMTEQELKDLQKIIELEEQRRKILESSKKGFEAEAKSYQQYMAQRAERQQEKQVERELQKAQQSGDKNAKNAIIQRELAAAQAAAAKLQADYQDAVQKTQEDNILTEDEKQKISELRNQMQRAMAQEDKWKERIDDGTRKGRNGKDVAGIFGGKDVDALDSARKPVNEINGKVEKLCRCVEKIQRTEEKNKKNNTLCFS